MNGVGSLLQRPAGHAYEAAKLRWATHADLAALEELLAVARPEEPEPAGSMPEWLEHGGALLLENEEGVPLCAVRWRESEGGWQLDRVCTRPEARGMGFGRWLMTKVEALAIRYNIPFLTVRLPDGEMAAYYRRLGYSIAHEPQSDSAGTGVTARKRVGGVWQFQEERDL